MERFSLNNISSAQNSSYAFFTRLKYSFINYQEAQEYKKENLQLKSEINQLIYENSQLKIYEQENERLKASLNFFQENQYSYVMAKVIGKDLNKDNTLIINKGSQDGLRAGYAAIVDEGIIIGKLIAVKDHISTVLLLTDNQSQLAISTLSSNKTAGLARGEYGLSLRVDFIPQNIELKVEDILITSGLEENIPRGFVIGKVSRIISNDNDLFKSVTISPLADYAEITALSIIIPKSETND